MFCLPKDKVKTLIDALRTGRLNPDKLADMSSAERREIFENEIGHGKDINQLFEQRLLLKNRQNAYIGWVKQLVGLKEPARRSLIDRIQKMDTVLNAKDEQAFLEDLAEKRLGVGVDFTEAQSITELAQAIKANESKKGNADYDIRMEYGRAAVALNDYVNNLKLDAQKTSVADSLRRPAQTLAKGAVNAPGFFKAVQAAFDDSAIFRQGWKTMFTNPIIWQRNARKSFKDIYNTLGGKKVAAELEADLVSRPNADLYKQAKLDVGTMEEAFPTTLPEKIPGIGRLYKASENAYTGFLHKTRADVFDKYIEIAKDSGVELDKQELENIGRLVNSLTGRGYLGALGGKGADVTNVLFFSPRNIKAHIDTLIQPFTGGASISEIAKGENQGSNFVRKEAAKNLAKAVIGTATVLMIAKFINPDSVDFDPRSADFGKIKTGKTRFDVTGGMGSLIPLVARMMTGQSKSSTSGKITDLTEGKFGQSTRWDVMLDFLGNKLSPVARVGKDFMEGKDFDGNKVSPSDPKAWAKEGLSLITPLPVKTVLDLSKDPNTSKSFKAFALAMDVLGVGTNTYGDRVGDSLGDQVRAGKLSKEEARKELEKQYKAGNITDAAAKSQLKDIDRDDFSERVTKLESSTESDFKNIEQAIKDADTPEKKTALWEKLTKLRKAKKSSPKEKDAADQLDLLLKKLTPTATKLEQEGVDGVIMPWSHDPAFMKKIWQRWDNETRDNSKWANQRPSTNVEDRRVESPAVLIRYADDVRDVIEIVDNLYEEERADAINALKEKAAKSKGRDRQVYNSLIRQESERQQRTQELRDQGVVVAN